MSILFYMSRVHGKSKLVVILYMAAGLEKNIGRSAEFEQKLSNWKRWSVGGRIFLIKAYFGNLRVHHVTFEDAFDQLW